MAHSNMSNSQQVNGSELGFCGGVKSVFQWLLSHVGVLKGLLQSHCKLFATVDSPFLGLISFVLVTKVLLKEKDP